MSLATQIPSEKVTNMDACLSSHDAPWVVATNLIVGLTERLEEASAFSVSER